METLRLRAERLKGHGAVKARQTEADLLSVRVGTVSERRVSCDLRLLLRVKLLAVIVALYLHGLAHLEKS
jgi:hypothetical protein